MATKLLLLLNVIIIFPFTFYLFLLCKYTEHAIAAWTQSRSTNHHHHHTVLCCIMHLSELTCELKNTKKKIRMHTGTQAGTECLSQPAKKKKKRPTTILRRLSPSRVSYTSPNASIILSRLSLVFCPPKINTSIENCFIYR